MSSTGSSKASNNDTECCYYYSTLMQESQGLDHFAVRFKVLSFHIVQKFAPSNVKGIQASLGMFVFLVLTQVCLDLLNSGRQCNNLKQKREHVIFIFFWTYIEDPHNIPCLHTLHCTRSSISFSHLKKFHSAFLLRLDNLTLIPIMQIK